MIPKATKPPIEEKKPYSLVLDVECDQEELTWYLKLVEFIMKDYNLSSQGLIIKGNS